MSSMPMSAVPTSTLPASTAPAPSATMSAILRRSSCARPRRKHPARRVLAAAVLACATALTAPAALACTQAVQDSTLREMVRLINAERAAHGLAPMRADPGLGALAQAHACDMARNGFFGHVGSGNRDFAQRVSAAGRRGCLMSENLAMGVRSARAAHGAWMGSGGHRANILNPQHAAVGLGVATPRGGRGMRWVTVFSAGC